MNKDIDEEETVLKGECSNCGEIKPYMVYIHGPPICRECFTDAIRITQANGTTLVKFIGGTTEYMPPGISC